MRVIEYRVRRPKGFEHQLLQKATLLIADPTEAIDAPYILEDRLYEWMNEQRVGKGKRAGIRLVASHLGEDQMLKVVRAVRRAVKGDEVTVISYFVFIP